LKLLIREEMYIGISSTGHFISQIYLHICARAHTEKEREREKQRQKDEKEGKARISSQRERRRKAPAIGRRKGRKIERASEKTEKYEKSREVHLFSKHSMRRRW